MSAEPRRRRGYVLVLALLLLVIAGAMLAVVARRSLGRAADAVAGERALQAKWAAVSIGDALPPRVDRFLSSSRRPVVEAMLTLGDGPSRQRVRLLVGDESAKANLNAVHERDPSAVPGAVLALAPQADLRLDLRPNRPEPAGEFDAPPPPFGTFGQVFAAPPPIDLAAATTALTVFGDGRLNLARASPAAVRVTTAGVLSPAEAARLVELRDGMRGSATSQLFEAMDLPQRDRERLSSLLTTTSTAQSVWVFPDAGPAELRVIESFPDLGMRRRRFAW